MLRRDFLKSLAAAVGAVTVPAPLLELAAAATTEPAQQAMLDKAFAGEYELMISAYDSALQDIVTIEDGHFFASMKAAAWPPPNWKRVRG